jgi:hypothetical protein
VTDARRHPPAHFVHYGDDAFAGARARIRREALSVGSFQTVHTFTPTDLPACLTTPEHPGSGPRFYVWKPHVVSRVLEAARDGDLVMYADSGCHFVRDPGPYLLAAATEPSGIYCMALEYADGTVHIARRWTKEDAFRALNVEPDDPLRALSQILATVFVLRRQESTRRLVHRWETLCQDAHLVDDSPSRAPNAPDFVAHRADQALWSILCRQAGATPRPDETYPPAAARFIAAIRWRT